MKIPVCEADVPFETWYAGSDREIRGKALCDVGGRAKIGVGLMELAPGSNTRPAHWHSLEEEHLYALSGEAVLHLGDERFMLSAGVYVCFPAGQAQPHFIHNTGTVAFRYLMIGERIAGDQVTFARR